MADTISTPQTGGLNYADYQERIRKAAAGTRATGKPSADILAGAKTAASKVGTTYKKTTDTTVPGEATTEYPLSALGDVAKTAVASYEQQAAAQEKQAEKAASALEMVGETTLAGMQNLERIQTGVRQQVQKASESWGAAAEKADEYVKASRQRVSDVLTKLDEVNDEFGRERSFAKAHAMQASVQAVIGSMRDEERNIAQTYGTESPEYQQFTASKRNALGTVQSNIHTQFQQLAEQQHQTFLTVTSDAYTKSNMYVGFQEQQHVEMLKYSEQAKTEYALQGAQLDASLEQIKMTGMENLANWIIETPSFTMDMTPLVAMLADLQITEQETAQAAALAEPQIAEQRARAERAEDFTKQLKRFRS